MKRTRPAHARSCPRRRKQPWGSHPGWWARAHLDAHLRRLQRGEQQLRDQRLWFPERPARYVNGAAGFKAVRRVVIEVVETPTLMCGWCGAHPASSHCPTGPTITNSHTHWPFGWPF